MSALPDEDWLREEIDDAYDKVSGHPAECECPDCAWLYTLTNQ